MPRLNCIDAVERRLGRHRCYTIEPVGGSDTPDLAPNPDGKSRTPATGRAMNDLPDPDRRVSTRAGSDTSSPLDPKIVACIVPLLARSGNLDVNLTHLLPSHQIDAFYSVSTDERRLTDQRRRGPPWKVVSCVVSLC